MSYDISLCDPVTKEVLHAPFPRAMAGGTYALGGTTELWLDVTYNYARWYSHPGVFPCSEDKKSFGLRTLHNKTALESIPILDGAITALRALDEDLTQEERLFYEKRNITGYWLPTRKNALAFLCQLLAMAYMRPKGIWSVE